MDPQPDVIFVIHQIGSGADGGIQSISELIAHTPMLKKQIITNIETAASARWARHGTVTIWPSQEDLHGARGRGVRHRFRQIAYRLRNNLRMFLLLRATGARVVHCNDRRAFLSVAFGARLAGARVILNVRDTLHVGSRSTGLWRLSLRLSSLFLVLSQEMKAAWMKALLPTSDEPDQRRKFAYLYSIVDTEICQPVTGAARADLRRALGMPEAAFALSYVARVDHKKAQLAFIQQALPGLVATIPSLSVHFVGDFQPGTDPYCAECAKAVEALGLGHVVHFEGYSPTPAHWYAASDIVALASVREGLPRAVIEGLACGASVVSFDVCSVREILEGHDCGRAVPSGDYDAFVKAVVALYQDEAERARLAGHGVEIARQLFRSDVAGRAYSDIIRELSGRKGLGALS
ncbi:MAG: glycosyltransferase [Rhizobiales bacterium]|nr:glycosyltransferase [Hyphomicrobiales bacterium]